MSARLPARLEVDAIRRLAERDGGFAMVLNKGDADAGSILLMLSSRGGASQYWERMPNIDGARRWVATGPQGTETSEEYGAQRASQDPDLWVIEIDVASRQRFVASLPA